MNCECLYSISNGKLKDYTQLARDISNYAEDVEFYPVAVSRLTKDICVTSDCDNFGNEHLLRKGQLVLFAAGKLHYMDNKSVNGKYAVRLFPIRRKVKGKFFADIIQYDTDW